MRPICSLLIALFCSLSAIGQVRYGILAGGQLADINAVIDLSSLSPDLARLVLPINPRAGLRAGLMADVPIGGRFSVRPQLLFSRKGGTVASGTFVGDLRVRFSIPASTTTSVAPTSALAISYVELPVPVMYKLGRLAVGAGPYVAVAVAGSINGEPIRFNTSSFRKLDVGAMASVIYELPAGLLLSAHYSLGLTNIARNPTPDLTVVGQALRNPGAAISPAAFGGRLQNRAFGVSVGYFFRPKLL